MSVDLPNLSLYTQSLNDFTIKSMSDKIDIVKNKIGGGSEQCYTMYIFILIILVLIYYVFNNTSKKYKYYDGYYI